MPQKWKTIRIFISSTFSDMHAERDHFVRSVYQNNQLGNYRIFLIYVNSNIKSANNQNLYIYLESWTLCVRNNHLQLISIIKHYRLVKKRKE